MRAVASAISALWYPWRHRAPNRATRWWPLTSGFGFRFTRPPPDRQVPTGLLSCRPTPTARRTGRREEVASYHFQMVRRIPSSRARTAIPGRTSADHTAHPDFPIPQATGIGRAPLRSPETSRPTHRTRCRSPLRSLRPRELLEPPSFRATRFPAGPTSTRTGGLPARKRGHLCEEGGGILPGSPLPFPAVCGLSARRQRCLRSAACLGRWLAPRRHLRSAACPVRWLRP